MGIAITKSELQQYRSLKQEIDILQTQLKGLEIEHDIVKGSSTEFPYNQKTIHIYGKNYNKMSMLYNQIEMQLEKRIILRIKIENFIDSIDDAQVRTIFRLRHIENKSWLDISMRIGNNYGEYAQRIHDRYLKKCSFCSINK